MVFNHLSGRDSAGEPAGVPMLYPDLEPFQLERFLTDLDYAHILYTGAGDYKKALAMAERQQKLYEPKMNERTLYGPRQNPRGPNLSTRASMTRPRKIAGVLRSCAGAFRAKGERPRSGSVVGGEWRGSAEPAAPRLAGNVRPAS